MDKIPVFVLRSGEHCDRSCPFLARDVWEDYSTCKLFNESLANIFDDFDRSKMSIMTCTACDELAQPQNTKES